MEISRPFAHMTFKFREYMMGFKHFKEIVFPWVNDHGKNNLIISYCIDNDIFRISHWIENDLDFSVIVCVETAADVFEYLHGQPYELLL